ncbi:MAG: hypothetical protein Q4G35_12210 [Propionibacteriaceae bacterium]|nr:hypothetical protein [Propionibacteriaceae bacterium]
MAISPAENYAATDPLKSERVGLLRDDGTVNLFDDTESVRSDGFLRQTYAGDMDERWAVWMETSSRNMFESNWRLFAHEIDGGQPILVAAAEDQRATATEVLPLVGGDPFPRLSQGLVWWWTATEQPDGSFRVRVLAADPAGGGAKEMLPQGYGISPVADGVVAVELTDAPQVETSPQQRGLVLIDVSGALTDLVLVAPGSGGIRAVASDDDIVAIFIGDAVLILNTSGQPLAQIPIPEDRAVWELAVCSGQVAFVPATSGGDGERVFIYDTDTLTLSLIDVPDAGPSVDCSDDRVSWKRLVGRWYSTEIAEW